MFCFKLWSQRAYALPQREPLRKAHLIVLRIFLVFCATKLLWKNVTSQRATYLLIFLRQQNYLRTTSHLWRCRQERAPEGSKSHRATHLSIFFAKKTFLTTKRNLGVEAKKRKSCRTCLIQISLRFASKISTLTTFSIVFGYRLWKKPRW